MGEVPFNYLWHPAVYSEPIMFELEAIVSNFECKRIGDIKILDPFAGTGRIHRLDNPPSRLTFGVEIEPEWANLDERTRVGDATELPFRAEAFHMVITSPAYGNRFADKHNAQDTSLRRSYTHDLRRMTGNPSRVLAPTNTGGYLFHTKEYKILHEKAWAEVWRVLRRRGWFVLNVSDSIRTSNGKTEAINVCKWHHDTATDLGFKTIDIRQVETKRLQYGINSKARVPYEMIYVMEKP